MVSISLVVEKISGRENIYFSFSLNNISVLVGLINIKLKQI